jgi:hypothetical protein
MAESLATRYHLARALPANKEDAVGHRLTVFLLALFLTPAVLANPAVVQDNRLADFDPWNACVVGDLAYVLEENGRITMFDISSPEMEIADQVELSVWAGDFEIRDGYAYVASGSSLKIIDIDPLETAHLVSSVETPDQAQCLSIDGDRAYVLAKGMYPAKNLFIVDIKDPGSPQLITEIPAPRDSDEMVVHDGYGYFPIDWWDCGLHIVDLRSPASASIVNTITLPPDAHNCGGIAVSGNYAYFTDRFTGLHIVDITNPPTAAIVKDIDTPGITSWDVAIKDGYAYILDATPEGGVHIIDSDPIESAHYVKTVETFGIPARIALGSRYAVVIYNHEKQSEAWVRWTGLGLISINTPEEAVEVLTIPGQRHSICYE